MQIDIVDMGDELRKIVERRFPLAPAITVDPIGAERFHEIEISAIGPAALEAVATRHFMPLIGTNFRADGVKCRLRYVDLERCHRVAFRSRLSLAHVDPVAAAPKAPPTPGSSNLRVQIPDIDRPSVGMKRRELRRFA